MNIVAHALSDHAHLMDSVRNVLPGFAIDARFRNLVDVDRQSVESCNSDGQRTWWWLMAVSILPLYSIAAACSAVLGVWQNS